MNSTSRETPPLFKNGIDSHLHLLSMKARGLDIEAELSLCTKSKMRFLLDMGIDADDLLERTQLPEVQSLLAKEATTKLYFAAGIFPSAVVENDSFAKIDSQLELLRTTIQNSPIKPIAIGELGIECHYPCGKLEDQEYLMEGQIEIADELGLPICIHNREADEIVLKILKKRRPKAGAWIHCFSSTPEVAKEFLDLGLYLSFCGNTTYKSSTSIQEALQIVPTDRILTETDSPYLAPLKLRGHLNRPFNTYYTAQFIAEKRGCTLETLTTAVHENFCRLLKIEK